MNQIDKHREMLMCNLYIMSTSSNQNPNISSPVSEPQGQGTLTLKEDPKDLLKKIGNLLLIKIPSTAIDIGEKGLNVVGNSASIVQSASVLAKVASETAAQPLGETVGNVAESVKESSKSLKTIAAGANAILKSITGVVVAIEQAIHARNQRIKKLDEQTQEAIEQLSDSNVDSMVTDNTNKNKLNNAISTANTEQNIAKTESDKQQKIQQIKSDSQVAQQKLDLELKMNLEKLKLTREKEELNLKKLEDDFQKSQLMYDSESEIDKTNLYIALNKFGYTDMSMNNTGWNKNRFFSFYRNYGFFYRVTKLVKIVSQPNQEQSNNTDDNLDVNFEKIEPNGGYYYVEIGEDKYKLNLKNNSTGIINGAKITKVEDNNNASPTKLHSVVSQENNTIPTLSASPLPRAGIVHQKPTALSSDDYKIVLTIIRFKIPKNIAGGKKTCRNRRRNRKTNRRIRKYY
jgi:hypothetical protein